jgi:signal transduction histidine kinase
MPVVAIAGLVLLAAGCLAAATTPRLSLLLTAAAATNAIVQVLLVDVPIQLEYAPLAGPAVTTATVTGALLLGDFRTGVRFTAMVAGVTALSLVASVLATGSAPAGWEMVLDTVIRGVGNGMAILAATSTVRLVARRADVEAEAASVLRAEQVRLATSQAEADVASRLLHDTFINTLGAISAGVPRELTAQLCSRCLQDLRLVRAHLQGVDDGPWDASMIVARARDLASVIGLQLDVFFSPDADRACPLPPAVGEAAVGVIHEALLNVRKHAGTRTAALRVAIGPDLLEVVVTDGGVGWDAAAGGAFGVTQSIEARARGSAGDARVESSPGTGTTVTAWWPMRPSSPTADLRSGDAGALPEVLPIGVTRSLTVRVVAWFSLMATVSLLHLLLVGSFASAAAAVALWLVALALVLVSDSTSWVPTWRSSTAAALLLPIIIVPTLGTDGCPASGPGGWGLDAAVPVMAAVTLLSSRLTAPFVGIAAVTLGSVAPFVADPSIVEACAAGSLQSLTLELGTFAAFILFRSLLSRLLVSAAQEHQAASGLRAQVAEQQARQQARETSLASVLRLTEPTLTMLASSEANPEDPIVRALCGRQQAALRSMLYIDRDLQELGTVLAELVLVACEQGKQVDIRSGEPIASPSPHDLSALAWLLRSTLNEVGVDETMMVTVLRRQRGGSLLVVLPSPPRVLRPEDADQHLIAGLDVQYSVGDEQTLMEVTWQGP